MAWWASLCVSLCLVFAAPPARPQSAPRALQVEAAFLVNFLRYTEWPPDRVGIDAPWRIAVVGNDDAVATVRAVAAAAGTVRGRRIEVDQVDVDQIDGERVPSTRPGGALATRLRASHLVFLHDLDAGDRTHVLRTLAGAPVLTVGDARDFAARGGMLGLVRIDARMGIEANPVAISGGGLQVSAKVLKLARIRRGGVP